MTARNVQDHVKAKGLPWSFVPNSLVCSHLRSPELTRPLFVVPKLRTAKGFDTFNPVSGFIPKDLIKDPHNMKLALSVRPATSSSLLPSLRADPSSFSLTRRHSTDQRHHQAGWGDGRHDLSNPEADRVREQCDDARGSSRLPPLPPFCFFSFLSFRSALHVFSPSATRDFSLTVPLLFPVCRKATSSSPAPLRASDPSPRRTPSSRR